MTYIPKNSVVYDQIYNIFYKSIGAAIADVRSDFVSDLEDAPKFLDENETDIKDAFYTAAWDAILTCAAEDRMDDEDLPFMDYSNVDYDEDDEEDSLLPDDTEKVHHF